MRTIPVYLAALAALACGPTVWTPSLHPASAVDSINPDPETKAARYGVRLHLQNGEVLVLSSVAVEGDTVIRGVGERYDVFRRSTGAPGPVAIPVDSVALIETAEPGRSNPAGIYVLGVWTTLAGVISVACVADRKSCFGSCPTFYEVGASGTALRERPDAEGFSASIARSLESTDLDALPDVDLSRPTFSLLMRNEALETHFVRSLRLHLVPTDAEWDVFASTDGGFVSSRRLLPPALCQAGPDSCDEALAQRDGREWRSVSDPEDLGAEQTIELDFPATTGAVGLVLSARHSFVSTYLLYQTMAYAGRHAGEWLAAIERRGTAAFGRGFEAQERIGQLLVERFDEGAWVLVGRYGEPGPLATDQQVIPVGEVQGASRFRLRFARGAWRIDQAALVELGARRSALVLEPIRVERAGVEDAGALALLLDPTRRLVTYPGDHYRVTWALPEGSGATRAFLESTGYYYEWMRESWYPEEDPGMLLLLATQPREALRRMAPGFKALEPRIEQFFWASRFGRKD